MKSKIGELGWTFAFAVFYAVVGGAEFFILFLSGFRRFDIGFLGALSLITAYGLMKTKRWVTWLVAAILVLGMTFGATTLYTSIILYTFSPSLSILLFHLALIAYLVLTALASAYVFAKRESF